MKFAHVSDVHIGSWRDPRLRDASTECFRRVIDQCITDHVDFVIVSGDLFNTSLPALDHLRTVVVALKKLKEHDTPLYYIAGSHDFSSSGKTMLDVLDAAGLAINVARGEERDSKLRLHFTTDKKTGVKLTGMLGRKGGLETAYYEMLDHDSLIADPGPKIFLFHSAIEEMKPAHLTQMSAAPLSLLPIGFDYYAGGHVHVVDHQHFPNHRNVVFPGPLFPCNFSELERLKHGGYFIVEDWKPTYVPLPLHPVKCLTFDCTGKTPADVEALVLNTLQHEDIMGSIVTLRLHGTIHKGRVTDISYRDITRLCHEKRAKTLLRNTYDLISKDFNVVNVHEGTVEDVERKLIEEHLGQQQLFTPDVERTMIRGFMRMLAIDKEEGETQTTFEKRLTEEIDTLFND